MDSDPSLILCNSAASHHIQPIVDTAVKLICESPHDVEACIVKHNLYNLCRNTSEFAMKIIDEIIMFLSTYTSPFGPNYSYLEFLEDICSNPFAIHIIEKHLQVILNDSICMINLSRNPAAIHIIEKHLDKCCWNALSTNPAAMHILKQYPEKINWKCLSGNPSIFIGDKDRVNGVYLSSDECVEDNRKNIMYKIPPDISRYLIDSFL